MLKSEELYVRHLSIDFDLRAPARTSTAVKLHARANVYPTQARPHSSGLGRLAGGRVWRIGYFS